MKQKTVRYTATLPQSYVDVLKEMADQNIVPSINYAINEALADYIVSRKNARYEQAMKEAGRDASFLERTVKCGEDFEYADGEVSGKW